MKPEKHHKIKTNARADARVKMHLRQDFAWLWGFPIINKSTSENASANAKTVVWQSLHYQGAWQEQRQTLNGQHISNTLFNRNKLLRDYPKALPRQVDDVNAWSEHIELKLNIIKALLEGETLDPWLVLITPSAPIRLVKYAIRLKKQWPEFADFIDQLAWWLSADLKVLEQALLWLEADALVLTELSQQPYNTQYLLPKLFYLQQKIGAKYCQSLMAILQNPAWQYAYTQGFNADLTLDTGALVVDPAINLHNTLLTWLDSILPLARRECRQHLAVLDFLFPLSSIDKFAQRWQLIDEIPALLNESRRLQESEWGWVLEAADDFLLDLIRHCSDIEAIHVPVFNEELLQKVLVWYGENPSVLTGLVQIVDAINPASLPKESVWQTPFLNLFFALHWQAQYDQRWAIDTKKLTTFLHQLPHFIRADQDITKRLHRLSFMKALVNKEKYMQHHEIDSLCSTYEPPPSLSVLTQFADQLNKPLNRASVETLIDNYQDIIKSNALSLTDFAHYVAALQKHNISAELLYDQEWLYLHSFAQGNSEKLIASLSVWGYVSKNDGKKSWSYNDKETIIAAACLYDQGFVLIADYCAEHSELALLKQCGRLILVFKSLKTDLPKPRYFGHDDHDRWINPYPQSLHAALKQLSELHPQAGKVAEKQLSQYIASPEKLKREIAVLEQKIQQLQASGLPYESLSTRLANQQARLTAPVNLSPTVEAKLNHKLHHAAVMGSLNHWYNELQVLLIDKIKHTFALTTLPEDSLGDAKHLHNLAGLLRLDASDQKIAKKVLHARLKPMPWDLRDERANQQFLEKLKQLDINTQPWVDGIGVIEYTAKQDKEEDIALTIAFEDDPLEVFNMGNHFQTCLSALEFNYFSVIANAADMNKRVIYLRNTQGAIVGRCLLAINEHGHLLHFHPYSHLGSDAIAQAVNYFADVLAKQMKTIRNDSGKIVTLVANEWYDDGAENYQATTPDFMTDKAFKKALLTASMDKVEQRFDRLLQQKVLKPIMIQHLLRLPEFKQRPELSLALLPAVKQLRNPDREINLKMARYLMAAGQKNLANYFVRHWRLEYRHFYKNRGGYYALPRLDIELLIEVNPSIAYRALMKTRDKWIKTDEQDADDRRLFYLGLIHEKLYRSSRALQCYQGALGKKNLSEDQVAWAKQRVAVLSEE